MEQADRPGSQHHHALPRRHSHLPGPVEAARDGLGQGQRGCGDLLFQHHEVAVFHRDPGHEEVFGQPAVEFVAEQHEVLAQLFPARQAGPAPLAAHHDRAGHLRSDGHTVDAPAHGRDTSRELVTEDHPRPDPGRLCPGDDPQVRAADGVGLDPHEHLTRPGFGDGHLLQLQTADRLQHSRSHHGTSLGARGPATGVYAGLNWARVRREPVLVGPTREHRRTGRAETSGQQSKGTQ